MSYEELIAIQTSSEAPTDRDEYTTWLHDKIIERVRYELWNFREHAAMDVPHAYAACNKIMELPAFQTVLY